MAGCLHPNATGTWSFLFSPAFGSYLQMLNWKALGEPAKAASAKIWFYISLVMLTAFVAINVIAGDGEAAGAANGLAILYLLVWYFAAGRTQAKYVKDKFGSSYPRRSWAKPLLIGAVATAGFTAVAATVTTVAAGQFGQQKLAKVEEAPLVSTNEVPSEKPVDAPLTAVEAPLAAAETLLAKIDAAPDCAAADVKEIITENYAEELVAIGLPDLALAVARDRLKLRVEMITEVKRNAESQNVRCSGKLVIEFPKEDLLRAAQTEVAKMAQIMGPTSAHKTSDTIIHRAVVPTHCGPIQGQATYAFLDTAHNDLKNVL
jgi:hypothetical protein